MSTTSFTFPTCGLNFKLLAPYNSDLQSAFDGALTNLKDAVVPNSCNCQNNASELGFTQDLTTCVECAQTVPTLQTFWGCDTCETMIAPLWFYMKGHVTPEAIQEYMTNTIFKSMVLGVWLHATSCEQGNAIRDACITNTSFVINTPNPIPSPTPTPTPSATVTPSTTITPSSNGLSTGAIIGIIIGLFVVLFILLYFIAGKRKKVTITNFSAAPLAPDPWRFARASMPASEFALLQQEMRDTAVTRSGAIGNNSQFD